MIAQNYSDTLCSSPNCVYCTNLRKAGWWLVKHYDQTITVFRSQDAADRYLIDNWQEYKRLPGDDVSVYNGLSLQYQRGSGGYKA